MLNAPSGTLPRATHVERIVARPHIDAVEQASLTVFRQEGLGFAVALQLVAHHLTAEGGGRPLALSGSLCVAALASSLVTTLGVPIFREHSTLLEPVGVVQHGNAVIDSVEGRLELVGKRRKRRFLILVD